MVKLFDMSTRERIEIKIRDNLTPAHMEVVNESHLHNVPEGSESHFKVVVVSEVFRGETLIGRHRRVNQLLREEFGTGLHALALHTMTPEEWFKKGGAVPRTPDCMGGGRKTD